MKTIRIAVCQIECHPALYSGYTAPIEEPFLTRKDTASLALLSTKGLDVSRLQNVCIQEYIEWSKARFTSIVDFFKNIEPLPDLFLFPEGAVPLQCLPYFFEWSALTGAALMAGTHTPKLGRSGNKYYRELNLSKSDINRLQKQAVANVLPLIRAGKTVLIPKTLTSLLEQTEVSSPDPSLPSLRTYSIIIDDNRIDLLPLICSEALQLHNIEKPYDLVGIVAYDNKPDQFSSYINQQVYNQNMVAFCNDGRHGGSFIFTAVDTRRPEWLFKALPTGLPRGDGILIADVDIETTAVQVGTASPQRAFKLIKLASIIYENSVQFPVAKEIQDLRQLDEPSVRAHELQQLLNRQQANSIQRIRLAHLHHLDSRGLPSSEYWEALGDDCLVKEQPHLKGLEKRLATTCQEAINNILKSPLTVSADVAPGLVEFLGECVKRAGDQSIAFVLPPDTRKAIIDRDWEVKRLHKAIDDRNLVVYEVTGLEQIGKSSIILKALAQSGISSLIHVPLTSTSSIDYILYSIIKQGGGDLSPPYDDPVNTAKSAHIINAIRSTRVLYLESVHHLLDHGVWRDELTPNVLLEIINIAAGTGTTIFIEGRWRLNLDIANPSTISTLRVSGLEKQELEHGISLFEAQLRRNGLSVRSVSEEDKQNIVSKLGGHPVAVALAANVVFEEGPRELLEILKKKRGFYLNYLNKLVRGLHLSKEERQILKLMALARGPVSREAILSSADFSAGLVIRSLIDCNALEVDDMALVQLPGILRNYFDPKNLPDDQVQAFHKSAAESYKELAKNDHISTWANVEAEYHSGLAGVDFVYHSSLADGALATAKELYRQQRYDEARKIVQLLLSRRKTHDLLRFSAFVEARTNNLAGALQLAKQVFSQYPKDTYLLSELTNIALTQYQADEIAEDLIAIARKAGVEDDRLLITEGRMLLRQRKIDEAERIFQRAAEITTKNPWPYYYIGQIYFQNGYVDEAIEVLKEGEEFCYDINSQNKNVYNAIRTQLGLVYLFSGQIDLAAPIIDSLIEEDPTRPQVARAYAALTIKRDGIKKAHLALERLSKAKIKSYADRCQFHLLMGQFYLGVDDLYKAAEEFEKAHQSDKSNVFVMMNLAKTYFDLGKSLWRDQSDTYRYYFDNCADIVRKILTYDQDNSEGIRLMEELHRLDIKV